MDKEKIHETLQAIGTEEDDVKRRELIAELDQNVDPLFDERAKAIERAEQLQKENEEVRAANMKLFTQLGAQRSPEQIRKEQTGIEPEPQKREYKDLFNEKGELKL